MKYPKRSICHFRRSLQGAHRALTVKSHRVVSQGGKMFLFHIVTLTQVLKLTFRFSLDKLTPSSAKHYSYDH